LQLCTVRFLGTFLVARLDRLARSTRDLLNTLALIAEKKAGFRFLGDLNLKRKKLTRLKSAQDLHQNARVHGAHSRDPSILHD
jgi:hypothetical protein